MRTIKVGNFISVLNPVDRKLDAPNTPVLRYQHARVTEVHPSYVLCKVGNGTVINAIRNTSKPHLWVWD